MSAALQFPTIVPGAADRRLVSSGLSIAASASPMQTARPGPVARASRNPGERRIPAPVNTLAFYRKHTERLLRRYLYISMLVGRTPTILKEPLQRGWASHCPVTTFEDNVIFVLDMEKCLDRLSALDRVVISRVVLQEYSLGETALLLNRSERSICSRLGEAVDRLTGILLETGIFKLPHQQHGAANSDPYA